MISWLSAALMLSPRVPVAYLIYTMLPILIASLGKKLRLLMFVAGWFFICYLLATLRHSTSLTAFLVQGALMAPFILAVLGVKPNSKLLEPVVVIRAVNALAAAASVVSLIQMGFPFRLPYIHFQPDFYNAFFGLGGAKIVTVIGFFGIVTEIHFWNKDNNKKKKWLRFLVALANFVVPNFILGMAAGVLALLAMNWRRLFVWCALLPIALVVTPYILYRLDNVQDHFTRVMDLHPKVYAYTMPSTYFADDPAAIFFGAGLGQYGGNAALWVSPGGDLVSTFARPSLPGYFAGEPHLDYVAPVLLRFHDNFWAINSSVNKPYTSLSFAIVEAGVPVTLLCIFALVAAYSLSQSATTASRTILIFVLILMAIDLWHDSPWFGFMLLLVNGCLLRSRIETSSGVVRPLVPSRV